MRIAVIRDMVAQKDGNVNLAYKARSSKKVTHRQRNVGNQGVKLFVEKVSEE
jgi:hypothetical protein